MGFEREDAIQIANQAVLRRAGRSLSDVEIAVLGGAWERLEYDQIAARNQYATSYISNDVAPKLWRLLTDALGQKVRKSNFKAILKQAWESKAIEAALLDQVKPNQVSLSLTSTKTLEHLQSSSQSSGPESDTDFVEYSNYISRPPVEQTCYKTVLKPGSLLRIKAPNKMGKTLLANHVLCRVAKQSYRRVHLSLQLTEKRKHLIDLGQFLRWFCLNVSRELGITDQLDDYWSEDDLGAKVSCTTYFEQYILPYADSPLVLCLDDVDFLFPYPEVYEDFFGLLRSWYEKARSRAIWKTFRLIIVHATDVYIRLNIHQSPFNVGVPITLPDFTVEQARRLANTYQLDGSIEQIGPLLDWVGGHPYLLCLAFTKLANQSEDYLPELLNKLPTDSGIYGPHLRAHLLSLDGNKDLVIALKQVITAPDGVKLKTMVAYKLQSMGLISLTGNIARSRCRLYSHYFADRLEDSCE